MIYAVLATILNLVPCIFRSGRILTEYYGVLRDHVSDLLSHNALRPLKIIDPYLVKQQERMTNAQLLMYGPKHLEQNFLSFFSFFLNMKVILGWIQITTTVSLDLAGF